MPLEFLVGNFATTLDMVPGVCASLPQGMRARPRAAENVQVLTGADALAAAAPAWRVIEAAGGLATPFQSLAMAEAAVPAHLARGEVPRIAVVRESGRPMAIFPAVTTRLAGVSALRFLGDPLIQYGDALAAPEARAHHLQALWDAIADPHGASLLLLRKVRADAHIARILARETSVVCADEAPFVDLRADGSERGRDARELRRFRRRLAERGCVAFEIQEGAAAIAALDEAIAAKEQWLDARGLVSAVLHDPHWKVALRSVADSCASSRLAIARLSVDGRLAAAEVGFIHDARWYAFMGVTTPEFAKVGPGHVAMAETIAYGRAHGLAIYDLMPPGQPYKRAMAHGTIAVRDHARALNLRGHMLMRTLRMVPAAKDALAALPPGLRRVVARCRLGPARCED